MRKIHCEDCRMTLLQWAWGQLNPIWFFTKSRDFCEGWSPWKFYTYLPRATFGFYWNMIPYVVRELKRRQEA